VSVAFSGERGAFAELAAIEHFGPRVKLSPVPEFSDVFNGVSRGDYRFGVVPIENSLAGSIHQNYDLLLESGLHIVGEVQLRIRHFLIVNKGTDAKKIRKILSHPAVFPQCRRFLKRHPRWTPLPVSNTAAAVKIILTEKLHDAAAIGSLQAAIDFDMRVVARNIEDPGENTTRFLVVAEKAKNPPASTKRIKSSIVFSMKDIPGALYKCLSVFALRDINLYKIESRPVHGKGFQYLFYLDFEGDARHEVQRNAINHLQEITTFYRFLGSYAMDAPRDPAYGKRE